MLWKGNYMNKLFDTSIGVPNVAWLAGSISGGIIIVCLGIKSIFAQDIVLEAYEAKLTLSTAQLKLAHQATDVANATQNASEIVRQLKWANNAHAEANRNLMQCQRELEEVLPDFNNFPRKLSPVVEPLADKELDAVDRKLQENETVLKKGIEEILEIDTE